MEIHWLSSWFHSPKDLCQTSHIVHTQDVDVILTAERLDQGEVNLKCNVLNIFLLSGQETQNYVVGVPKSLNDKN